MSKHINSKMSSFRQLLLGIVVLMLLAGCSLFESDQERQERMGAVILSQAREALYAARYDEARDSIMSLRQHTPLAFDARQQAILLLDSIELMAAKDSLAALPPSVRQMHITTPTTEDAIAIAKGELPLVDEYERLLVKVQFYERKLLEDQRHTK